MYMLSFPSMRYISLLSSHVSLPTLYTRTVTSHRQRTIADEPLPTNPGPMRFGDKTVERHIKSSDARAA